MAMCSLCLSPRNTGQEGEPEILKSKIHVKKKKKKISMYIQEQVNVKIETKEAHPNWPS